MQHSEVCEKEIVAIPFPPDEFMAAVAGAKTTQDAHHKIGAAISNLFKRKFSLLPTHSILDIGSGCGRIAAHFAGFTTAPYRGFDVVKPMVDWCRDNITSRYANFQFEHADLANTLYSKTGADASSYVFPYADKSFDFVFATSVFTHLFPKSAAQYANEIHRVLKPGGNAFLSFYVTNDDRRDRIAAGENLFPVFPYKGDGYSYADKDSPEHVIAFEQSDVEQMLKKAGFKINDASVATQSTNGIFVLQDHFIVQKP